MSFVYNCSVFYDIGHPRKKHKNLEGGGLHKVLFSSISISKKINEQWNILRVMRAAAVPRFRTSGTRMLKPMLGLLFQCSYDMLEAQFDMEFFMEDLKTCKTCGVAHHWRRFRVRLGGGVFKESDDCVGCRSNKARLAYGKAKREAQKLAVLNRTAEPIIKPRMQYLLNRHADESFSDFMLRMQAGYPYYYPKVERAMKAYCNKKTAMDRKYLRDNEHLPLSYRPHIAHKQQTARDHAKGWIGFYEEICNHAINLLRATGTRPPWALMEGKGDLHKMYGVFDTRRAQLLRKKG